MGIFIIIIGFKYVLSYYIILQWNFLCKLLCTMEIMLYQMFVCHKRNYMLFFFNLDPLQRTGIQLVILI
jgi:hypothetical protein